MSGSKKTKEHKSREEVENEYKELAPIAKRFCDELAHQIETIIAKQNVSLGFPLQRRVKTLESIAEKFDRLSLGAISIKDLQDLVGLRLILLFSRDVEKVCRAISGNFDVIKQENTIQRLKEDQFGYSSVHFVVRLPKTWLSLPSFSGCGELIAEIQVRTVTQHIWAAASHILQYKNEENVPLPVRRSLSRVSALLETVDLEFERFLEEREIYRSDLNTKMDDQILNVDLLEKILDSVFPAPNKSNEETYGTLLKELTDFEVNTVGNLKEILNRHYEQVMEKETTTLNIANKGNSKFGSDTIKERVLQKGVFYSHCALAKHAMSLEFVDRWRHYVDEKINERIGKIRI